MRWRADRPKLPIPVSCRDRLQCGDLIVTGRKASFNEITQFVSRSRFGHVAAVIGGDRILESADTSFTVTEFDEGAYAISLDEFWTRAGRLDDLTALRPRSLDTDRFELVTDWLLRYPPPYPTLGAPLLGFCCALAPLVDAAPTWVRDRLAALLVRVAADGPIHAHCSEVIVRVYEAAGMEIDVEQARLKHLIEYARRDQQDLLPLTCALRPHTSGAWPTDLRGMVSVAGDLGRTVKRRWDKTVPRDYGGLLVPADLRRSTSFEPLFSLVKRDHKWIDVT